jgi:hypothetical protein
MGWLLELAFDAIIGNAVYQWLERQPKWVKTCFNVFGCTLFLALTAYYVWTLIQ